MSEQFPSIAIVGSTGAVGQETLKILESRNQPPERISLYASNRSAGKHQSYLGTSLKVYELNEIEEVQHDYVLLCSNAQVSKKVHKQLLKTKSVLIDNSSAFRMDQDVPLIIPEVNGHLLKNSNRLIANPNCSTVMLLSALNPLREVFGIDQVIVSTYQAVSGAGLAAIDELSELSRAVLDGESKSPICFPHSCAFNVFEHESKVDPITGLNGEETKMVLESRKIWNDSQLSIVPTCVRVPVERAHSQSIVVELGISATLDHVQEVLDQSHLRAHQSSHSLTPLDAVGKDGVLIGRVRMDMSGNSSTVQSSKGRRLMLWICCDQLRKGAALNVIEIMDLHRELSSSIHHVPIGVHS